MAVDLVEQWVVESAPAELFSEWLVRRRVTIPLVQAQQGLQQIITAMEVGSIPVGNLGGLSGSGVGGLLGGVVGGLVGYAISQHLHKR